MSSIVPNINHNATLTMQVPISHEINQIVGMWLQTMKALKTCKKLSVFKQQWFKNTEFHNLTNQIWAQKI